MSVSRSVRREAGDPNKKKKKKKKQNPLLCHPGIVHASASCAASKTVKHARLGISENKEEWGVTLTSSEGRSGEFQLSGES